MLDFFKLPNRNYQKNTGSWFVYSQNFLFAFSLTVSELKNIQNFIINTSIIFIANLL